MHTLKIRTIITVVILGLFVSCRKENNKDTVEHLFTQASDASVVNPIHPKWNIFLSRIKAKNASFLKTDEYYKKYFTSPDKAIDPTTCNASALNKIVEGYFKDFKFWDYVLFSDYVWINQLSAITDRSTQYFGQSGQYTHLVTKYQRKLQSFWNLKNYIQVNGEHSETLGNRDKIAQVFIQFSGTAPVDAYYVADQIIAMNKDSKVFPHSPLLSFDGFATTKPLIVLGDGLIEAVTATGVTDDIVVAGLLSHEWGHEVQFENSKKWFGVNADDRPFTPEFSRQMELEADFFSSYFLTHKRGGTYNWKGVAQFNELFFNIGDCDFTSADHHGTPAQRRNSADLGYTVASSTRPKGHILTADQLHAIFMKNLPSLLK
ncbi:MAG: hypothetical protein H0X41_03095 [Chitinophagaceae bacterium]|nr:hypothetical protein [Chitinophagaceae bacterium]